MRVSLILWIGASIAIVPWMVTGHSESYPVPNVYHVVYPGGHIAPNGNGVAFVTIQDTVTSPVGGFACQDLNADVLCGGVGELGSLFCQSVALQAIGAGGSWDPFSDLHVFVDDATTLFPTCGPLQFGVAGDVSHS